MCFENTKSEGIKIIICIEKSKKGQKRNDRG
jgi:hypothetical protein